MQSMVLKLDQFFNNFGNDDASSTLTADQAEKQKVDLAKYMGESIMKHFLGQPDEDEGFVLAEKLADIHSKLELVAKALTPVALGLRSILRTQRSEHSVLRTQ